MCYGVLGVAKIVSTVCSVNFFSIGVRFYLVLRIFLAFRYRILLRCYFDIRGFFDLVIADFLLVCGI